MALITCPECTREISDRASSCPHCGYPLQEQLSGNSDVSEPVPKKQRKPKKKLIILLSILACLIMGAAGWFAYILIVPNAEQSERVAKDKNYLYKWMTEHGTLVDGTILQYSDTDTGGNKYTLYYNPNKIEQCRWYVEYEPAKGILYSRYVWLTLFGGEKSEEVWITFTSQSGNQTRMAYYHTLDSFTRNAPVEFGETYCTDSSDNAQSLCEQSAQLDLCKILDWLKNSFCPATDMTMADFGYPMYE